MRATQAEINRALYGSRSKYGAKRHNGYASKREANVAAQLQALERGGVITDLQEQVVFELIPDQIKATRRKELGVIYVADFSWRDRDGKLHVGDAKGARTALYIVKRKLMLFIHKIEVEEF